MKIKAQLLADLEKLSVSAREADYARCGYHLEAELAKDQVREVANILLEHGYYLVFVSALHIMPVMEVVYQFAHFDEACRIKVRVPAGDSPSIPTISDIFEGANWHERETRDFFGVNFEGHPNLTPLILAEEDADLKPLLKDKKSLKSFEAVSWREKDGSAEKAGGNSNLKDTTK